MNQRFQSLANVKHQHGAALIIGLLLMVVITVLAVSGMNTATTELAMARNDQTYETAFQAAETGLETALGSGQFNTVAATTLPQIVQGKETIDASIVFTEATLVPPEKAGAYSIGAGTGVAAYHFLATSSAQYNVNSSSTSDRDAAAVHTQAFFKVGPASSSL